MTDGKLIDSNILVYAFDQYDEEKRDAASKIISSLIEKGEIVFSVQNLSEFFVIATKKIDRPIPLENAKNIIIKFAKLPNVKIFPIHSQTIIKAIGISETYSLSYWDALIASVMQENNVNSIITENDKDFRKIPWIKVTNPFK